MAWEQADSHYVPLKGSEAAEDEYGTPECGQGFSTRRPASLRAFGRFDRAGDILPNIVDQTRRVIIRAETNRVAKTFVRFAAGNPSPHYKFGLSETCRRINPQTGLVEMVWVSRDAHAEEMFAAKIRGKTY